uniref:Uncharacterized protein n=1 Tax=Octopus bimaculoides TaxID=37653 RepID=A0A0L8GK84_OCTBM
MCDHVKYQANCSSSCPGCLNDHTGLGYKTCCRFIFDPKFYSLFLSVSWMRVGHAVGLLLSGQLTPFLGKTSYNRERGCRVTNTHIYV